METKVINKIGKEGLVIADLKAHFVNFLIHSKEVPYSSLRNFDFEFNQFFENQLKLNKIYLKDDKVYRTGYGIYCVY